LLRIACLACAVLLGGCDTMSRAGGAIFGGSSGERPAGPGVEAHISPLGGSAVTGSVRFVPRGDGVSMLVQINGLPPGRYRVLVHENGNCTSPNGFSAGPPWSPASSQPPLYDRLPIVMANSEGTATLTVRLSGVSAEQLSGRSVVVHDTVSGPYTAQPGVRNARIACGVLGTLRTLLE